MPAIFLRDWTPLRVIVDGVVAEVKEEEKKGDLFVKKLLLSHGQTRYFYCFEWKYSRGWIPFGVGFPVEVFASKKQ